jgi:hypothetical protein
VVERALLGAKEALKPLYAVTTIATYSRHKPEVLTASVAGACGTILVSGWLVCEKLLLPCTPCATQGLIA